MSSNTYPVPSGLTLPNPQGVAPYSVIESERWQRLIETTNTAYGTGALQLANMAWGDDVLTTSSTRPIPYLRMARLRLPVLSTQHTELALAVRGTFNQVGSETYSRVSIQEPGSSTNRARTQIASTTAQWHPLSASDDTGTLTIDTSGDYYDVEVASFYSTNLSGLSIYALPLGATATAGWPATDGDLGTTEGGGFTPSAPAAAASGLPLSAALAEQMVGNVSALSARRRPIMCGIGCRSDIDSAALYCTAAPKIAVTPVWQSANGQDRELVYHVLVTNPDATAHALYIQHGVGGLDAMAAGFQRDSSYFGVTRVEVAASSTSWVSGSLDLTPAYDDTARVSGYPAFQCVGLYWDDALQVESYSMWEEEA